MTGHEKSMPPAREDYESIIIEAIKNQDPCGIMTVVSDAVDNDPRIVAYQGVMPTNEREELAIESTVMDLAGDQTEQDTSGELTFQELTVRALNNLLKKKGDPKHRVSLCLTEVDDSNVVTVNFNTSLRKGVAS